MDHQVFGSSATADGFASLQPGIDYGYFPSRAISKRPSWPVFGGCGTYPDQTFNRFAGALRFSASESHTVDIPVQGRLNRRHRGAEF